MEIFLTTALKRSSQFLSHYFDLKIDPVFSESMNGSFKQLIQNFLLDTPTKYIVYRTYHAIFLLIILAIISFVLQYWITKKANWYIIFASGFAFVPQFSWFVFGKAHALVHRDITQLLYPTTTLILGSLVLIQLVSSIASSVHILVQTKLIKHRDS
jgi:hypothetical protein